MSTWNEQLGALQKLREQRRAADDELYAVQIELLRINNSDDAEGRRRSLEERKKRARAALDLAIHEIQVAVEGIYEEAHPRSVVSNMDDSIPFLMLPVRIETRFKTELRELWLRIYPDDIAIHTHEKALTDNEISEGEKYWGFLFVAEKGAPEEREDKKKDAWSNLVLSFSAQRAAWIARQTKPENWNDIETLANTDQLIFPHQSQSKPFEWSRAPRTNVLPDKFVVMFYQGNTMVKELPGPVIQDELYVGPDPLESESAFVEAEDDKMLVFGTGYDWTANFDRAVEKGMGFKVPLNADEAQSGFDKILVLGVYASADEMHGKQAIETLIDNHHYSPKGFGIVKQGTPTNNTEQESSGFSTRDTFDEISFFVETGKPVFEEDEDCDGKNLADALGIAYAPLQFVVNSNAKERKEAIAMNTALYPSTLGYYFSTMMKPVMNEVNQDILRNFFINHVSGAGPLPAIRVGNQPYGVLLTSDFSNWQWGRREPDFSNAFLNTLLRVLNHYHSIWLSLLPQLPFTGKPGTDPSEVLMNILGLHPGSVAFFQRNAYSTEYLFNRDQFQYGGRYYNDLVNSFTSKATLLNFLGDLGFEPPLVNGKADIPQLLRLVYQHYHTALDAANVVERFPLADKPLHNYTEGKNYIHWLQEATSVAQLEKQDFGTDIKPPTSLLYMQLRRSLLLAMADASVKWFGRHNIALEQVMEARSFHNIRPQRDLTKWEVMKGKVANALPNHPQHDMAIAEHLLTTGNNESEASFLNRMKESLAMLAGVSANSLQRMFCEHIDACTYRLDAWQTALFDQRLKKQRQVKKGIYLASFGWVEDIRPDNKQQIASDTLPAELRPPANKPVYEYANNGGFVHAPSINQATAAAVLRSGYLNHASTGTPDLLAVNLSSERVRRALFILEGIRNGQTLEALLGFQFERGLHDRGSADDSLKRLNEYIYDFRDEFTIEQHVVDQQGIPGSSTETIEKNNVVNGLKLAETQKAYPYDVTIDLSGLSPQQVIAIETAIKEEKDRLEDTLDAVKDLFLSESVFQMVQGNFDRAAAMTTALRDAAIPPGIEVIDTPATNHLSFTNRVTVHFDPTAVFAGNNPRAKMEPGINEWLKKQIGGPDDIICLLSHMAGGADEQLEISLGDCNLEPIDLLYIAGNDFGAGKNNAGVSELESRLVFVYRNKQGLTDDVAVKIQYLGTVSSGNKKFLGNILPLAIKLKQLITDSRPLHALDFQPPSRPLLPDKTNPHGYITTQLQQRVEEAKGIFEGLLAAINTALSNNNAAGLQAALINVSGFGLPDSFPQVKDITVDQRKLVLMEQGTNTASAMSAVIAKTGELLDSLALPANGDTEKKIEILVQAAKVLFGDMFNVLPHFNYNNPADIQQSNANRDRLLSYSKDTLKMPFPADEWMQKIAPVRPRTAKWEEVRTIYELYNDDQLLLAPVQLPFRANDNWLAVEFPEKNADNSPFTIIDDTISVVIHGEGAFTTASAQCGLLIDEWTEVVPGKEALTGLTFNYNQPDAMPPQALLLAVTPQETGAWSWEKLVGILNDTLLRAKLRAVEPQLLDKLQRPDTGVLLPAVMSEFSQYGLDISLDYRLNVGFFENNLPLSSIG
jgi:hypothetical protein